MRKSPAPPAPIVDSSDVPPGQRNEAQTLVGGFGAVYRVRRDGKLYALKISSGPAGVAGNSLPPTT
jgi:hypothetical protein